MPIQFIDNRSAIDHATRKRIRSHVAMGRNVGKTIVRRSKTKAHELRVKTTLAIIHTPKVVRDQDHEDDLVRKKGQVLEVEQPIGDWLSILSFEQKNIGSRKLVQLGMYRWDAKSFKSEFSVVEIFLMIWHSISIYMRTTPCSRAEQCTRYDGK